MPNFMKNLLYQNKNINSRNIIIAILVLAFILRLLALIVVNSPDSNTNAWRLTSNIANNLADGKGYTYDGENPDFYMFPAYMFFLASIRALGLPFYFAKVLQCLMGALICLIIYHIGRKAFDRRIGLGAAFLWAIYPYSVMHSYHLEDSTMMVFLSTLCILLSIKLIDQKRISTSIILGFCCGITILTRSTFATFLLLLLPWSLVYFRFKYLRYLAIIAVAIVFTVSPWLIRNYIHTGYFTLGTHGGFGFWSGNNPKVNPLLKKNLGPDYLYRWSGYFLAGNEKLDDVTPEFDKIYYNRAVDFIKSNPKVFIENILLRLKYSCGWQYFYRQTAIPGSVYLELSDSDIERFAELADEEYSQTMHRLRGLIYSLSYFPLFLMALAGFIISDFKSGSNHIMIIFIVSFSIVHLISIVTIRNRQPIDALMTLYASSFIFWAIKKLIPNFGKKEID